MNRIIQFFIAALHLLPVGSAMAQAPSNNPTHWTFEAKKTGDNKYNLILHLKLDEHWHIYSMKPGGDGSLISPAFSFDKNANATLNGGIKESGKKISEKMEGIDGIVNMYKGSVDYIQSVTVKGNGTITGKYNYQVCDESICLPPVRNKVFTFTITDATGTAAIDTAKPTKSDTSTVTAATDTIKQVAIVPSTPAKNNDTTAKELPEERLEAASPFTLFSKGLGNGLLAVVTPCVFAMLPMTVSFFLKRSKDRKTGIKIALQYSLSIIVIFTAIGALISAFLSTNALNAFSTNWIVNLGFFAIFLLFGISFLGAFEIGLPSSWATKMDSKANTNSFLGIFFMALTLVIVSFSCTVPFIGTMVVMVKSGGKFGPLLGFTGFGTGLALPFAVFAFFPTLLNELGKSGGWLNVIKVTFGFIELALAMKFLSVSDLQKHWRLLDREIFLAIWIGLSFTLGAYLLGIIRFSHDSEMPKNDWGLPYLKVPRLLFALSAIAFGFYLLPGMWGAPLNAMSGIVPPAGTQDWTLNTSSQKASAQVSEAKDTSSTLSGMHPHKYVADMKIYEPQSVIDYHLETYYDYKEALAASKALKKPVFLDFTGIACANCRKLESTVWADPQVLKRMKTDFVVASLFCDAYQIDIAKEEQYHAENVGDVTNLGEANSALQANKFHSAGQPRYYFVDENGTVLSDKVIGYPVSAEDFVKHLDAVKAKYKELHP